MEMYMYEDTGVTFTTPRYSVAPIIGSVIGKTIYRLFFVYRYRIGTTIKKQQVQIYLEIHAHVHQMMLTNVSSCIFNIVITTSMCCQLL